MEEEILKREVGEKVYVRGLFESEETKDLGDGVLEATVNTGEVDREGEQIDIGGVDIKNYKDNSVVLYGHDYYSLPIGKSITTRKLNGKIISKFKLAVDEYDFAATVYNMIKGGYLNAVSIGVIVKEWSQDYSKILKSEMVEFSVVPVPADRGALIQRSLGKSEEEFRSEYKDFVMRSLDQKASKDELEKHIINLKNLVALLEDTHKVSQKAVATEKVRKIHKITLTKTAGQLVKEAEKAVHILKISLK